MKVRIVFFAVVVLSMLVIGGCGQDRGASETTSTTSEETGSTGEGHSEFEGVVDSYSVAHEEIEEEGGEQEVGPYRVGYIVEPAEGWWGSDPEDLQWREPRDGETNHIEILPYDKESGLLIPEAKITLTVVDESGEEVESKKLNFYYAEFYHYANNFSLPRSGEYTLQAKIEPPTFLRHGSEDGEGKVYTDPVTVEFEGVEIDTEE